MQPTNLQGEDIKNKTTKHDIKGKENSEKNLSARLGCFSKFSFSLIWHDQ